MLTSEVAFSSTCRVASAAFSVSASEHAKVASNSTSRRSRGELPNVPKATRIYLYCHSGKRAELAQSVLQQRGYTNVTAIGGLQDWLAAGGAAV